jgi:DNA repair protein RadC
LNSSIVHPRELFKSAINKSAAAIILAHNHPSGDATPSREDIEVTKRIKSGGQLLGIDVIDHIIIGDNCYYSFKEEKMI